MAKRLNTLETSIQLRPEDLAFLYTQVSGPDLNTRNVSGFGNNLVNKFWGTSSQPFLHLAPAHFEPDTVNGIRHTSADGNPLPNPRLISDIIGQQSLGTDGNSISLPNAFG